jgi:hypothetical protein
MNERVKSFIAGALTTIAAGAFGYGVTHTTEIEVAATNAAHNVGLIHLKEFPVTREQYRDMKYLFSLDEARKLKEKNPEQYASLDKTYPRLLLKAY